MRDHHRRQPPDVTESQTDPDAVERDVASTLTAVSMVLKVPFVVLVGWLFVAALQLPDGAGTNLVTSNLPAAVLVVGLVLAIFGTPFWTCVVAIPSLLWLRSSLPGDVVAQLPATVLMWFTAASFVVVVVAAYVKNHSLTPEERAAINRSDRP